MSFTANGFNAIITGAGKDAVYFQKLSTNVNDNSFISYFGSKAIRPIKTTSNDKCGTLGEKKTEYATFGETYTTFGTQNLTTTGGTLRTFRLAVSATAEFNTLKGTGNTTTTFNAIVAYINRLIAVYRTELSVSFTLVSSTNLVATTIGTPFTNANNNNELLAENQTFVDNTIGDANYDLAFVLGTSTPGSSSGGVALASSVGSSGDKAKNATQVAVDNSFAPVFDDQTIAHEVGHQYSMSHTYNSSIPVCTTREPTTSVEVGSGTTIMSYGYTCSNNTGNDDYENIYLPFLNFHAVSYSQAVVFLATTIPTVGTSSSTGNSAPVISAISSDRTIPKSTPFFLTGAATDVDGSNALTYSWEGTNIGTSTPVPAIFLNTAEPPFFRSYVPVTTTTRYYPRLSAILDGTNTARGDKLPSVGIVTTHRFTVRDNVDGVNTGTVSVTIDGSSGPFLETTNLAGSYASSSTQTITWSVNNTTAAPVSCANVDILLSVDGGQTFPHTLVAGTPNDGTQDVTLPALVSSTTTARIKVQASDNIFFDISNANFSIAAGVGSINYYLQNNTASTANNWTTVADGSGTVLSALTATDINLIVDNETDAIISSNLTLGSNSKIIVSQGVAAKLTINNGVAVSGTIDVGAAGTLAIATSTIPTLGTLATGSTVSYNATTPQVISQVSYHNLTITDPTPSGTSLSGTTSVAGVFRLSKGILTTGANNLSLGASASGIIESTAVLNISGGTTNFNGRPVTLQSSSISNGGAIGTIIGTLSGATAVTVQRFTQALRGYRTLSHPFSTDQALSLLTNTIRITGLSAPNGTFGVAGGNPSVFNYNPMAAAGTSAVLVPIIDATANVWSVGTALYTFIRGNANEGQLGSGPLGYPSGISPVTITGTGAINQGNVNVNLQFGDGTTDNFNLIGNPYPCPINLRNVTGIPNGTIYAYNPIANINMGDAFTVSGGFQSTSYTIAGTDFIIPTMGGFYVKATDAGTVTFAETDKITNGSAPTFVEFGSDKKPRARLAIAVAKGKVDEIQLAFNGTSTSTATDTYDAEKFNNSLLDFYSLSSDNKRLAIDYRSDKFTDATIPLGIKTNVATRYTISLSEFTDMPNIQLVLKDKLLNVTTPLALVGDNYSFDITADAATKGNNRFELALLGTTVLPVQITDITAQLQTGKKVAVNWTSATETNLANYQVQRSTNGSSFSTVGTVAAKGAGSYSYLDDLTTINNQTPTIYYRLEAVDKDGSKTYSKVVSCQLLVVSKVLSIYPNPVQATLFAQVTESKAGKVTIVITDMQGKLLRNQTAAVNAGVTALSVDASGLAAGNYVLVIINNDGEQQKQKFVKK
jgi:hypothetical protein